MSTYHFRNFIIIILLTAISIQNIGGCGGSGSGSSSNGINNTAIRFTDITSGSGLNVTYRNSDGIGINRVCAGVAAGDIDNDNFIDLYVVAGDLGTNQLLKNMGDGNFTDITADYGLVLEPFKGCGPHFADYDGDGDLDLFIGGIDGAKSLLLRNSSDKSFEDVTDSVIPGLNKDNVSATFGDYDLDGDLDLFLARWNVDIKLGESTMNLWEYTDGKYSDVSLSTNISEFISTSSKDFSFAAYFSDINNDTHPDILITSDFGTSKVFLNNGDKTFSNITSNVISDANGMGSAVGDYDNDLDLDWFVTSIFGGIADKTGNRLYRNKGDGTFEDATEFAGVREGFFGWGSCMADFNNDGNLDIFHVNGWTAEFAEDPSRLFISNGNGTFDEKSVEYNLIDNSSGRGVVCFDFDRDGDIDLFFSPYQSNVKLYRNDGGNMNNFINIKLNGISPNTQAIGSRIYIEAGGKTQMRELNSGNNYVSQNPVEQHFGLGNISLIDEIKVEWLDGKKTVLNNIDSNQFLVINHPDLKQ